MNQKNEKELRKYYKKIRTLFPVYTSTEKRFFSDLQDDINEFISDRGECELPDIVKKFGEPQDIIGDYLEMVDSDDLYKHIKRSKYIRVIVLCALFAIALSCAVKWGLYYKSYLDVQSQIITKEVTTIY